MKGDPEVYPRVGKTDQPFRLSDGPAIHSPSGAWGALVVRQHGASNRVPQRLAGRTRQQRRADTPGAVRADGADRLILARKVIAERPQRDTASAVMSSTVTFSNSRSTASRSAAIGIAKFPG